MPATIDTVQNLDDLKTRVKTHRVYAILLAGGLAYSRKTIRRDRKGCWQIKNHIDGTTQHLCSDDGLWMESNIGQALDKGALVQLEHGRTIRGSVEA